jgi:hypothetical protein
MCHPPMGNSDCAGFMQLQCLEISELHSCNRSGTANVEDADKLWFDCSLVQRDPVIRWAGEPCSSASSPGQNLQNAIGSGFSGGLGPDPSTSGRYHRGFLRRCHCLGRTESRPSGFPESDSPLAKLYPLDVVRHSQRFSIQQSDSISGQSHAALLCEPYSSRVERFAARCPECPPSASSYKAKREDGSDYLGADCLQLSPGIYRTRRDSAQVSCPLECCLHDPTREASR